MSGPAIRAKGARHADLGRPDIDWVAWRKPRRPGARVTDMDGFNRRFAEGIRTPGPFLVEVVL